MMLYLFWCVYKSDDFSEVGAVALVGFVLTSFCLFMATEVALQIVQDSVLYLHDKVLKDSTTFSENHYQLTRYGRVTYICISRLTITSSENGLSPSRRQAITWTNGGIFDHWQQTLVRY